MFAPVARHGKGLQSSSVYVNGKRPQFEADEASVELPTGEEVEVYWRAAGDPKSTLTIRYRLNGKTRDVVDDFKIPKKKTRKSDFTLISI